MVSNPDTHGTQSPGALPSATAPAQSFPFPQTLQTPNLLLSLFSPTSPQDVEYATSLFPGLDTLDDFLAFCAQRAPAPCSDSAIVYLLRLRQSDAQLNADADFAEVIGHVSLAHSLGDRQPCVVSSSANSSAHASAVLGTTVVPDIGWRLRPAYEGHGFATEAASRFLQYLTEDEAGPKFEVLSVFTGDGNVRSLGLAERTGFVSAIGDEDEDGEDGDDVAAEHEEGKEEGGVGEKNIDGPFKGILGCERVRKGIWFGVRPAGWRWREGRRDRELRRCIEKLFE